MKHTTYINNSVQVDHYARVKIANLDYNPEDDRPDCKGSLYVAPLVKISGLKPEDWAGELCLYATTNADPIRLGYVRNGGVEFVHYGDDGGMNEKMLEVLKNARWNHPEGGESYSYVIEDAIRDKELDELSFV